MLHAVPELGDGKFCWQICVHDLMARAYSRICSACAYDAHPRARRIVVAGKLVGSSSDIPSLGALIPSGRCSSLSLGSVRALGAPHTNRSVERLLERLLH